jgi:hypothetical protein
MGGLVESGEGAITINRQCDRTKKGQKISKYTFRGGLSVPQNFGLVDMLHSRSFGFISRQKFDCAD